MPAMQIAASALERSRPRKLGRVAKVGTVLMSLIWGTQSRASPPPRPSLTDAPIVQGARRRATGGVLAMRCARPQPALSLRARRPPEWWPAPPGNPRSCAMRTARSRGARPGRRQRAAARVAPRAAATDAACGRSGQIRLRAQRPSGEIGHAAPGVGSAGQPAARVAGISLGEAPARAASAREAGIRTKPLKFQNSRPGKQVITGRRRRVGNNFRHRWRL
jgi:hypothetical protein